MQVMTTTRYVTRARFFTETRFITSTQVQDVTQTQQTTSVVNEVFTDLSFVTTTVTSNQVSHIVQWLMNRLSQLVIIISLRRMSKFRRARMIRL